MSEAGRRHVFSESKRPEQKEKNTHEVDIIYVVQLADKLTFCVLFLLLRRAGIHYAVQPIPFFSLRRWATWSERRGGAADTVLSWQKKAVIWAKTLMDPSEEDVSFSGPGAVLCLPVGNDSQIRSQKFPSDVCWGKTQPAMGMSTFCCISNCRVCLLWRRGRRWE